MSLRLAAAATLVAAAFAALIVVLVPATPARSIEVPEPTAAAAVQTPDAPAIEPWLVSLVGEGTDLAPEQAASLSEAGDLVCEGLTAEVPVAVMSATLADQYGLTGEEGMRLVNVAAVEHCR